MTAMLNENPLINASDNVSSLILDHNKNVMSIFDATRNSLFENENDGFYNNHNSNNEDDDNKLPDAKHVDEFTASEVFEMIRSINDPEHPLTLEQLNVVSLENVKMDTCNPNHILINYTPTIPHCSMATLIGLSLRVKLLRSLPQRFKVSIAITPGTHQSEKEINKQLNDKERVAAALENYSLIKVVNQCIKTSLSV
mmetsp:Transcript_6356/g.10067  ORF Transcript_6356/g.10067 Transcript_6356/m.10067 type:complete len:197 (-) Transcript_6356:62-652(-)|eukprot:CAMPEP_0202705514 /NCGR_PEP_ID=MMETSP1385-20130828/18052_1 /ASSEMBLY_ACC=CAM_ASM_000861 /TAXON_ID=933848 /ORGANISM="Elphidium margaritaceum" /LENGTH=196 /DNA_ID=CAMNT_0049363757 /DNA_START=18 /DNA_END=608 /DNA_ORIENTATION=+